MTKGDPSLLALVGELSLVVRTMSCGFTLNCIGDNVSKSILIKGVIVDGLRHAEDLSLGLMVLRLRLH